MAATTIEVPTPRAGGATDAGRVAPPPPPRPLPTAVRVPLDLFAEIGSMVMLLGATLRASFTPPFSWRRDFVDQAFIIVKRCFIPVVFSTTMFGLGAPGLQGGNVVNSFGSVDRLGAFFVMASVREFAPWINGMVIAGVGGTAIAADLGARKIRDELDAIAVLGLDPVREIVVPRFWALGLITPLMNLIAIVCGVFGGWIAAVLVFGETSAGYLSTFTSNFTMPDLLGSVLKTTMFGFIIALVCCYKGMHVKGGTQGVGRAVNQAVVIAFAGIWVFNAVFTTTLLAAFPETGNLH